ncbi:Ku protein [Streptomyces bluensis]|uniref:Ku protein n=1 Tax=Streptomyces bluensis TaxID=33897 RepID=A0ABW6UVC9_9ACTN
MPASIFNGVISFGLVSVPITVLSATDDHSVRFRRIHTADRGLVRNRYWCEVEDREISFAEIGHGYELPDGRVIPVTDEELRALPLPTARAIELIAFIPAAAVDPLRIGTGYYLQPQGAVAAKPYLVLRHALERASRVAVARYAWHGRERLGLLRTGGDHLFQPCGIPLPDGSLGTCFTYDRAGRPLRGMEFRVPYGSWTNPAVWPAGSAP